MPFTFSHPAVVLPLAQRWKLSVTGLVIGSIAPDVEYFIRMQSLSRYSHTLAGVFWFDLPLGLLIAYLFHAFLRNSLIPQLPSFARKRYQHLMRFNWNQQVRQNIPIVVASFIAGSLSHLLWDLFTHEGAKMLQGLFEHYTPIADDDDFLVYYLFFSANSVAGLWALRRYFWRLPAAPVAVQRPKGFAFWSFASMATIVIFSLRVLTGGDLPFLSYIDSAISSFMLSVILTVAVQKFFQRRSFKAVVSNKKQRAYSTRK